MKRTKSGSHLLRCGLPVPFPTLEGHRIPQITAGAPSSVGSARSVAPYAVDYVEPWARRLLRSKAGRLGTVYL
jgi:hypothetical protein